MSITSPLFLVFDPQNEERVARGVGVATIHLASSVRGVGQLLNGITEFAPGTGVPMHTHNCEESALVLDGEALFEAEGESVKLEAGSVTWTATGVPHRFSNRGQGTMRIFWTYGSVSATRTIVATRVTFPIGSSQDIL